MTKAMKLALFAIVLVSGTQAQASEARYQEGEYTVSARVGIAPSTFKRKIKTETAAFAAAATPTSLVVGAASDKRTSDFNDVYALPVTAGFDIGYVIQDNLELFANFDFAGSKARVKTLYVPFGTSKLAFKSKASKPFRSYAGFLGARNYFCQTGDFLPFVGAKLGLQRYNTGCANFAGGVQFGVDYLINDSTALTFMSEVIGTTGKKRFSEKLKVTRFTAPVNAVFASQLTRNTRSSFSFPVTLGVRVKL